MKQTCSFISMFLFTVNLFLSKGFAQDYVHYATLSESSGIIWSIAFSPDGRTLAGGSENASIYLWDVVTGTHRKTLRGHTIGSVYGVSFSPDGRTLASGGYDGAVYLWDVDTGTHHMISKGHKDIVRSLSFSPDGRTLASGSNVGNIENWNITTVRLWNVATGKLRKTLNGRGHDVSFSPDGHTLASWSSMDSIIYLSDVATGKLRKTLNHRGNHVGFSVSFSPDGHTLASWSDADNTISFWDVATATLHRVLSCGSDPVSFSPDGRIIVGRSSDGTIHLWDPISGEHLKTLKRHSKGIGIISFSPDSNTLASASLLKDLKTTIFLWKLIAFQPENSDFPSQPKTTANQVYNNAIRSVMWIVNPGIGDGSGVLLDKKSKLAVTNAHVIGQQDSIDIYFPAPDEEGELIKDRNFYLTNKDVLKRLGYYTKGHVVARNEKTDLAIIRLDGLPETTREIDWSFTTPITNAGDLVYILGNPGRQDLWRWTLGEFLKDHEDYLHIQSDVFGGNSGGPVLNKQGIIIGIVARSDQLMNAAAIPIRHINSLLFEAKANLLRMRR